MSIEYIPVIIIGAARSGTNMLRDTLCKAPGFDTWDCDEINPIWRHGNTHHPDDHFTEGQATPNVKKYLRKVFDKQWKSLGKPKYLVEKTCANSLRVSFIARVFPEAQFIYIVRNGVDVTISASKRWRGEMEIPSLPYYWSKIKHTPSSDIVRYAWRFFESRAGIFLGKKEHMSYWGPQFPGLRKLTLDTPLLEICAQQWAECINASDTSFASMDNNNWIKVKYEDLVLNPESEFMKIHSFLKSNIDEGRLSGAIADVSPKSINKNKHLAPALSERVMKIMELPMRSHGYIE